MAHTGGRPYFQAHEKGVCLRTFPRCPPSFIDAFGTLSSGVKLIGATAHFASAELDEGPISSLLVLSFCVLGGKYEHLTKKRPLTIQSSKMSSASTTLWDPKSSPRSALTSNASFWSAPSSGSQNLVC